jgi:hypothetical protein
MDGMFLENGPYRVNPDLSLNISVGGWQDHANIVFGTFCQESCACADTSGRELIRDTA